MIIICRIIYFLWWHIYIEINQVSPYSKKLLNEVNNWGPKYESLLLNFIIMYVGRNISTCEFETWKWSFIKTSQIVQLHTLRIDTHGKYKAFGIKGCNWPSCQTHESLTIWRSIKEKVFSISYIKLIRIRSKYWLWSTI